MKKLKKKLNSTIQATNLLFLTVLLGVLFLPPVQAGEYDDIVSPLIKQEGQHWKIRGEALMRKIDLLIREWHQEKSRDLEKESYLRAIAETEEFLRREDELLRQAESDCGPNNLANIPCPAVKSHKAMIKKVKQHQQKMQSTLKGKK